MYKISTIGRMFLKRIEKSKKDNAIGWIESDEVKFYTYQEYFNCVESIALSILNLGLQPGDKLAIFGHTCKEWHLIDMACLCVGIVVVPIYPTYTPDEVLHIFNHSECSAIALENSHLLQKIIKVKEKLNSIKFVISFSEIDSEQTSLIGQTPYLNFLELLRLGSSEVRQFPDKFKMMSSNLDENSVATIIYTSGTTGGPKGAVIKQKAVTAMLDNTRYSLTGTFSSQDRSLTFLPLSHVLGRADSMIPLVFGGELVFAQSFDTLINDMLLVRPTVMIAVPRIFEKMNERIQVTVNNASIVEKMIFRWAEKVSNTYFEKIQSDLSPSTDEILARHLAYKLVYSKIYNKFGGNIRFFISGGAPLSVEVIKSLRNCNLTILEGYGLTETIAPFTLNPPSKQIPGTVGIPLGNGEIQFAEDGEIILKSEGLFSGYYKNEEETQKAIKDGWFYTGDIGEFTPEGYLKITDRKKDIIITSGGKNIPPQKLENLLKNLSHISQALIIGDRRPYVVAIIGIEKSAFLSNLEEMKLPKDCSLEDLSKHPAVQDIIQKEIDTVNQELASFETIKKFFIAPEEFSVEKGSLTPSLKLKRKVLLNKYQEQINALYSGA